MQLLDIDIPCFCIVYEARIHVCLHFSYMLRQHVYLKFGISGTSIVYKSSLLYSYFWSTNHIYRTYASETPLVPTILALIAGRVQKGQGKLWGNEYYTQNWEVYNQR